MHNASPLVPIPAGILHLWHNRRLVPGHRLRRRVSPHTTPRVRAAETLFCPHRCGARPARPDCRESHDSLSRPSPSSTPNTVQPSRRRSLHARSWQSSLFLPLILCESQTGCRSGKVELSQIRSFLATHCSPPYWSGGETRSLSILRPTTVCSYALAVNPPVRSTQMHQEHGRSLGPVPSTHLQKPAFGRRLSLAAGFGTQNSPTSLWREAHLDRERTRRWAEHCRSVNEIGAKACAHGSTMERERPRLPRKVLAARPPMNGVP